MLVPAGDITDGTAQALLPLLTDGDTLIDGGNSKYTDTMRRARMVAGRNIHYVDCIKYGLMQAYAEGFSILQHKREFDLDLHQIVDIWRYGAVVRSWLLDLTAKAAGPWPMRLSANSRRHCRYMDECSCIQEAFAAGA